MKISVTPLVSSLQGTDRLPVGRPGNDLALATDLDQVAQYLNGISTEESRILAQYSDYGVVLVAGPKIAGSVPPVRAPSTDARIAIVEGYGIPPEAILWVVIGEYSDNSAFGLEDINVSPLIDSVVMVQSGGVFSISDMVLTPAIDTFTIFQEGANPLFSISDLTVSPLLDSTTMVQEASQFAISDMTLTPVLDAVTISFHGIFTIADMTVIPSVDTVTMSQEASLPTTPAISVTPGDTTNVIALTSGGTGATSYDLKWGTVSGSRTNTISGVTLPYTHTGRTNGTQYFYSLVATNGAGSVESAEVSGVPFGSVTFSENLNSVADGALPSSFLTLTGTTRPVVEGHQFKFTSADSAAYVDPAVAAFPPAQHASLWVNDSVVYVGVRIAPTSGSGAGGKSGYFAHLIYDLAADDQTQNIEIIRLTNGTSVQEGIFGAGLNFPGVLDLKIDASNNLTVSYNGVPQGGKVAATGVLSNGQPGMRGTNSLALADDFSAGSL